MCGIIGIISKQPISSMILRALKLLEYRGYDSAGIATLVDGAIGRWCMDTIPALIIV